MKKKLFLFAFLILSSLAFGQITQINNLRLESLDLTATPGEVLVSWHAEHGTKRYSNERFAIRYSQHESFIDAEPIFLNAWDTPTELNLSHKLTGLADGTWYISVGFAFGTVGHNIVDPDYGPVDDWWTEHGVIIVDNSYKAPELVIPQESPYKGEEMLLQWTPTGPNITTIQLQASHDRDFPDGKTVNASIPNSENGDRYFDLTQFNSGIIYFRIRGHMETDFSTEWSRAEMWYQPERNYIYTLPYLIAQGENWISFTILDKSAQTADIQIGILPEKTGNFTPSIWWQNLTIFQDQLFLERVGDLFPFDVSRRALKIVSSAPLAINVYHDFIFENGIPVQIPYLLPEGTASEWYLPPFRKDSNHLPSLVVANADTETQALFQWRLDYKQDGQNFFVDGSVICDPFENEIIDIGVDGDYVGNITITCTEGLDVAVLYSNRNGLGNGIIIYGFSPLLMTK